VSAITNDRRAWPRRNDIVRVAVTDLEDALEQPYTGWIMNRCPGGVCISFDPQTLDVGNVLAVQPYWSRARVEVRVKNTRRKAGQVHLGCEFVQPGAGHLLLSHVSENWFG